MERTGYCRVIEYKQIEEGLYNKLNKLDYIIYSLLYGGIVGNLFDRIVYGYVIDYLDFYIFNYNFPVFNFADVCIVISVILIIFDSIRGVLYENRSKK